MSDQMGPILVSLGALILTLSLFVWARPEWRVVPEGRRLVVYRWGRFRGMVGPGLVFLFSRIDQVHQTLDVRNQPARHTIDALFVNGIAVNATLNLWYRCDPTACAEGDRNRLLNLLFLGDSERRMQVEIKLREALVNALAAVERQRRLPDSASFFERLLPVIPGTPRSEEMIRLVRTYLTETLPSVGIVLDTDQPLTILRVQPPEDLTKSFTRDRAVTSLRQLLPGLSDDALAQMLSSIEGLDAPMKIQRIVMEGDMEAAPEFEQRMYDSDTMSRVSFSPAKRADQHEQKQINKEEKRTELTEHLEKNDLTLLKRLPRNSNTQQVGT